MARSVYQVKPGKKGFWDGVRRRCAKGNRPADKVITEKPLDPVPDWLEPVKGAENGKEQDKGESAKAKGKQGGKKGPAVAEGNEGSPGLPEKPGSATDAEVI